MYNSSVVPLGTHMILKQSQSCAKGMHQHVAALYVLKLCHSAMNSQVTSNIRQCQGSQWLAAVSCQLRS